MKPPKAADHASSFSRRFIMVLEKKAYAAGPAAATYKKPPVSLANFESSPHCQLPIANGSDSLADQQG